MTARPGAPSRAAAPERLPGFVRGRVNEIQRVRILDSMARACVEFGAANVTVTHVVESSGISRRTFYELFAGGEECLLAALDDALERASVPVLAAYRSSEDWRERVRAALLASLVFLEEEPFMGRLIVAELHGGGAPTRERRRHVLAGIVEAIDEGRSQPRSVDPPSLTAEGVLGGMLAVLNSRLQDADATPLVDLVGPLMSLIVLPYLGVSATKRELARPVSIPRIRPRSEANPLRDVEMRLTYRTARVLASVAGHPGASNRELALVAGIQDQGQISKLVSRLAKLGLIENSGEGHSRGAANAWSLTDKGDAVHRAIGERAYSS